MRIDISICDRNVNYINANLCIKIEINLFIYVYTHTHIGREEREIERVVISDIKIDYTIGFNLFVVGKKAQIAEQPKSVT